MLFVESRRFLPTTLAFDTPVGVDSGRISRISLATENWSAGVPRVVVCVILCLVVRHNTGL